jgi:putative endonuclease
LPHHAYGFGFYEKDAAGKEYCLYCNKTMKDGGWVYMLASQKMGTIYIGSTSDLIQRIAQHKAKTYKGFTEMHNVDKLVWYEWHERLDEMVLRERQIKEWKRNWKLKLIIEKNPHWIDLYDEVLKLSGFMTQAENAEWMKTGIHPKLLEETIT